MEVLDLYPSDIYTHGSPEGLERDRAIIERIITSIHSILTLVGSTANFVPY